MKISFINIKTKYKVHLLDESLVLSVDQISYTLLPLIGPKSMSLFLFLFSDSKNSLINSINIPIERVLINTKLTLSEFNNCLQNLIDLKFLIIDFKEAILTISLKWSAKTINKDLQKIIGPENFKINNFLLNKKELKKKDFSKDVLSSKDKIILSLTPNEYIFLRLNRKPLNAETKLIEKLVGWKIPFEFINLIIDFSIIKNNGIVPKYIEKISMSIIKEKSILTLTQLKNYLKTANKLSKNNLSKNEKEIIDIDLERLTF